MQRKLRLEEGNVDGIREQEVLDEQLPGLSRVELKQQVSLQGSVGVLP